MNRISFFDIILYILIYCIIILVHNISGLIKTGQSKESATIVQSSTPFTQYSQEYLDDGYRVPTEFIKPSARIMRNHTFQLVLFTTEDGVSPEKVNKIKLFRDYCDLFASKFNFQAILFTRTPQLLSLIAKSSIIPITDFLMNPYGLPIITSLYSEAQSRFNSAYYGYINSDILVEPTLFSVLDFCETAVNSSLLNPCHEIAGRVYERKMEDIPSSFSSFNHLESYFSNYTRNRYRIRSRGSADYFIFSKQAMHLVTNTSQTAVIGRMRIDNFLMGVVYGVGELVDATLAVKAIHEGVDGFYNRKVSSQTRENKNWNYGVMKNSDIHYAFLSEPGNKALRLSEGSCCTLSTVN